MIPAVGFTWRGVLDGLLALAAESAVVVTDHVVREVQAVRPKVQSFVRWLPYEVTTSRVWQYQPFRTMGMVAECLLSEWSDDPPTLEEISRHSDRAGYWAGWSNWQIMLPSDQTVMIEHIELNADDPAQIAERLTYAARQGACSYRAVDLCGDPCWWWREPRKTVS